ncbi:armadillo-type protein [Mycena galericulata]|nr:armadillo-type protein [Mycena galericulata]
MQRLTRQQTPASIHSWWSDSNPGLQGATINLHAATKPLMKLMYHRQAMGFIKQNRGVPLSTEILETFSSYLPWNYISPSTKAAILLQLAWRACSNEDDARFIVGSFLLTQGPELLGSSNADVRESACRLLGNLAAHESVLPSILDSEVFLQLVSLLQDKSANVIAEATYALMRIAQQLDGAQAVVTAQVPNRFRQLLESSDPGVRTQSCALVGRLAIHESTMRTLLDLKLCRHLVSLLRDKSRDVIDGATHALAQMAVWPDGAQAVVDARAPDCFQELLKSSSERVRNGMCRLLVNLVHHEFILLAMLDLQLCMQLGSLLRDKSAKSLWSTISVLNYIAQSPDGARAVVDAKALDHCPSLLLSSDENVRGMSCQLVAGLAGHDFIPATMFDGKLCVRLVSLLRDEHVDIIGKATYALARIAVRPDGAQTVVEAKVQNYFQELLKSPNGNVHKYACWLVGNIASHEFTARATFDSNLCLWLLFLARTTGSAVQASAIAALARISHWFEGVTALAEVNISMDLGDLSDSVNRLVLPDICTIRDNISRYDDEKQDPSN